MMNWNMLRNAAKGQNGASYDAAEAADYAATVGMGVLDTRMEQAYLADLAEVIHFQDGQRALDVGAGTGAFSGLLAKNTKLRLTALDPSPAMLTELQSNLQLAGVETRLGSCDDIGDADLFEVGAFDYILSRKVLNSLLDPIQAFRNWMRWLRRGGKIVAIDGLFSRDGWQGKWAEQVDMLPLSAVQSMATAPYLMQHVGFRICDVRLMQRVNETTRTPHFVVVAEAPG